MPINNSADTRRASTRDNYVARMEIAMGEFDRQIVIKPCAKWIVKHLPLGELAKWNPRKPVVKLLDSKKGSIA